MSVKTLREEHADATRTALLNAARELFVERGYSGVSAEEIAQRARVTRGALYHHFKDKKDLFGCICDEVGNELGKRVEDVAMPLVPQDPWLAFSTGIDEFLDACEEGDFQRLAIIEGPAVFGWTEWREHAEVHMIGLIRLGLQVLMDAGVIRKQPIDVLAPMFFSVLNESAMLIGLADDRKKARKEVGKTLHDLMDGLRVGA